MSCLPTLHHPPLKRPRCHLCHVVPVSGNRYPVVGPVRPGSGSLRSLTSSPLLSLAKMAAPLSWPPYLNTRCGAALIRASDHWLLSKGQIITCTPIRNSGLLDAIYGPSGSDLFSALIFSNAYSGQRSILDPGILVVVIMFLNCSRKLGKDY